MATAKTCDNKCGEDVETLEPSCIAGGRVKWCSSFGKLSFPQNFTQSLGPRRGVHPREWKVCVCAKIYTDVHSRVIRNSLKEETVNVCQLKMDLKSGIFLQWNTIEP